MPKVRVSVAEDIRAAVLYESAYTCCKCEERRAPVQIHHIDDNPANNDPANLAVLCLYCHDETQVRGGFGRRLLPADVRVCRDRWLARVAKRRSDADAEHVRRATEAEHQKTAHAGLDGTGDIIAFAGLEGIGEIYHTALDDYIESLPDELAAAIAESREDWDSGVTVRMVEGTLRVIQAVKDMWLRLAETYPKHHFGGRPAAEYIDDYVRQRSELHYAVLEPGGPGTGGTIVRVNAAAGVAADLNRLVVETVDAIRGMGQDLQVRNVWMRRWEGSSGRD